MIKRKPTTRTSNLLLGALISLALAAAPAVGQISPGADLEFDASADTDADQYWEDVIGGNPSGLGLMLDDSPAVTRVAITGSSTQFTHAYDFPGGSINNEAGALLVAADSTTTYSFQDGANPSDWTNKDVTMEIWFKPDNLTPTPTNGQIIFEDGGGSGLGLFIRNNEVLTSQDGGEAQIAYNLSTDPSGLLLAAATSDFIQAVVTRTAAGATELFINGQSVGTSNDPDGDWSGGDGAAFGTRGESNVGGYGSGQMNTESFDGQITLIRVYSEQILTQPEVQANFAENSGPDLVAPTIASTEPADDSTGVYPGANLVATFSEEIALKAGGTITLTDLTDGSDVRTITLLDGRVTQSGAELTIDPSTNLEFATEYEVTIDGSAIEDTADTPNAYGGTASGEWTFTTAAEDLTAPVISSTDPADEATNIAPGVDLVATFDENLVIGSGTITIVDVTDGTGTQVLSVPGPDVSIAGAVLTIDPPVDLEGATLYAVQLDAGVVKNFSDVGNAAIADTTTWNFSVTDTTTYTGPNSNGNSDTWNNAGNWTAGVPSGALNAVIPATTVTVDAVPPTYTGDLTLNSGATLRIEWLGSEEAYYDALGTPGQTVITSNGALINCRAGGAPVIPEIALNGDLTMVLSQSTQPSVNFDFDHGVSGSGTLILQGKGGSNANLNTANTMAAVLISEPGAGGAGFDVHATAAGSLGSGNVTVNAIANSANGTIGRPVGDLIIDAADSMADTATLNLNGTKSQFTLLTMNANDTVDLLNVNGFPYPAGTYGASGSGATYEYPWISGSGILTVSSAPADGTGPTLVGFSPADDSTGVLITERFILEFDEPVVASSGSILVKNLDDTTTTTVPAEDTYQVSISETQVVIYLNAYLEPLKNYAIQIEPTAFTDLFGNAYAGITDDTSWNFTTATNPVTLFSDDFEFPDVTPAQSGSTGSGGTSKIADTTKWVRATQGYGGSANGIEDEGAGFFTDPVGEQAYRFAYTNSGVTTAEGVIGGLMLGATYTVSFNVVEDGTNNGLPWRCKLVTFDAGARRDDVRYDNGTTVLRNVSGNAPSGGAYDPQSFTFTVDRTNSAHMGALGKDLALRFIGGTTSANIDNVVVSVAGETIAPTVVSIVDDVSGGPVATPDPVVYTVSFDEPMDAATIGTDDFENGSSAGISVSGVSATADPSVYEVTVTTVSAGDLVLQIKAGAVLNDANGNALDTGVAIPDDDTILVEGAAGNTYADWIGGFDVGGLTGFNDDPDGDGNANGLENYFGTDPSAFSAGLSAGALSGNTFTFTHPINDTPASDVSAVYRWSTDLDTYSADGADNGAGTTVTFAQGTPSGGMVTVTATITGPVPDKLFVDIEVTQTVP